MPVAALICWGPAALMGPVADWMPDMVDNAMSAWPTDIPLVAVVLSEWSHSS